jgi:hypothetical protein
MARPAADASQFQRLPNINNNLSHVTPTTAPPRSLRENEGSKVKESMGKHVRDEGQAVASH